MNPINPKVSLWTKDYHPYKSDKLEELDLYTVLKYCENIDPSALKGKSGSIFPYLSSSIDATDKYSDGVLFIDFDPVQISQRPYTIRSTSYAIYSPIS